MDNFIKSVLAEHRPDTVLVGEAYINSSEELLKAAKELAAHGEVALETLKPLYEEKFMAVWIKDDALKDTIKQFGLTKDNRDFILTEMKEIARMNREIATLIRNKIAELPV